MYLRVCVRVVVVCGMLSVACSVLGVVSYEYWVERCCVVLARAMVCVVTFSVVSYAGCVARVVLCVLCCVLCVVCCRYG